MNEKLLFGKAPPQSKDLEDAILGACLLEKTAFERASGMIRGEMFYSSENGLIFEAMQSLSNRQKPIDMMTVVEELRKSGDIENAGGPFYVSKLTNSVVSSANLESHCHIIVEKFLKRELIRYGAEIINDAYNDSTDAFDLIEKTDGELSKINENLSFGDMVDIDRVMFETVNHVHEWKERGGQLVTGVPSGFADLDKATRGWQDTNLIYIAARPSVGKTAFSLALIRSAAQHFASQNKTVAVWSLEMSRVQLGLRMLSAESQVNLSFLQTGKVDDSQLTGSIMKATEVLSSLKIKLDDTAGLTIPKLKSKARKLKRKNNLGIIFIDYLQLMEGEKKGNREQEVSGISRQLKLLAKDLNIPIIALAQLSREVEKRASGIPQLSDLRESGSIEQDADVVMMLYGETEAAIDEDADKEFIKYVKIAKQRDGVLVTIPLHFDRYTQKFSENKQSTWKPISNPDKFIQSGSRMYDDGELPNH